MPGPGNLGKILIIMGFIMAGIGVLLYFSGNFFSWLGNLPGDIKIKRENFTFYFPITTMILISLILNIIIRIINYFLQ